MKKLMLTAAAVMIMATGAVAEDDPAAQYHETINLACNQQYSSNPHCSKRGGNLMYLQCLKSQGEVGGAVLTQRHGALSTEAVGRFGIGIKKVVGWDTIAHNTALFTESLDSARGDALLHLLSLPMQRELVNMGSSVDEARYAYLAHRSMAVKSWQDNINGADIVSWVMAGIRDAKGGKLDADYAKFLSYFFSGDRAGMERTLKVYAAKPSTQEAIRLARAKYCN